MFTEMFRRILLILAATAPIPSPSHLLHTVWHSKAPHKYAIHAFTPLACVTRARSLWQRFSLHFSVLATVAETQQPSVPATVARTLSGEPPLPPASKPCACSCPIPLIPLRKVDNLSIADIAGEISQRRIEMRQQLLIAQPHVVVDGFVVPLSRYVLTLVIKDSGACIAFPPINVSLQKNVRTQTVSVLHRRSPHPTHSEPTTP